MYAFTAFILLPVVLAAQVRLTTEKSGHMLMFPTWAFQVPQFVPPSEVGSSIGSLPKTEVVSGKSFNRIIQVGLDSRRALILRSQTSTPDLA